MNYTIALFPKFKGIEKVNEIREKYDRGYKFLEPHIALVYYFSQKPDELRIQNIANEFSSFEINLEKIRTVKNKNYIFLDPTYGKDVIIKLKNRLDKDLDLKWNKSFRYKPHLTIANFKTKAEQRIALKEIRKLNLNFSCKINSFEILEVSDDQKTILSRKKYNLKSLHF